MAQKSQKQPENVQSKYYVDTACTGCSTCNAFCPGCFKMSDDATHAYVYKQPEGEQEEAEAKEAMESCPSGSIGDDGNAE